MSSMRLQNNFLREILQLYVCWNTIRRMSHPQSPASGQQPAGRRRPALAAACPAPPGVRRGQNRQPYKNHQINGQLDHRG